MEDIYLKNIRIKTKEIAEDFRYEIRDSKHDLLKIVGIELIPVVIGASLGGVGRATGEHWIPAVPIGMDLIMNATGYGSARGLWNLVKYCGGVALPYSDKIYLAVQENMPAISQTVGSFIGGL